MLSYLIVHYCYVNEVVNYGVSTCSFLTGMRVPVRGRNGDCRGGDAGRRCRDATLGRLHEQIVVRILHDRSASGGKLPRQRARAVALAAHPATFAALQSYKPIFVWISTNVTPCYMRLRNTTKYTLFLFHTKMNLAAGIYSRSGVTYLDCGRWKFVMNELVCLKVSEQHVQYLRIETQETCIEIWLSSVAASAVVVHIRDLCMTAILGKYRIRFATEGWRQEPVWTCFPARQD